MATSTNLVFGLALAASKAEAAQLQQHSVKVVQGIARLFCRAAGQHVGQGGRGSAGKGRHHAGRCVASRRRSPLVAQVRFEHVAKGAQHAGLGVEAGCAVRGGCACEAAGRRAHVRQPDDGRRRLVRGKRTLTGPTRLGMLSTTACSVRKRGGLMPRANMGSWGDKVGGGQKSVECEGGPGSGGRHNANEGSGKCYSSETCTGPVAKN